MARHLDIVIIGAGLGGLSAAVAILTNVSPERSYSVTVLEAASELGEIGAGIQVTPNFTRLLHQWGLAEPLAKWGVKPLRLRQRRWQNGKELTVMKTNEDDRMQKTYGYEYYQVHRADLHQMLLVRARELGAKIVTNAFAEKYECVSTDSRDAITTFNGRRFEGDLIVACDGAKSSLSNYVLGERRPAIPTGDSAYRGLLTREQISDPDFAELELDNGSVIWLGPNSHVVGYLVRGGQRYNLVFIVPDTETNEESWKLPGDMQRLKKHFEGWDWRLQKIVSMVESSYIWNLRDRPALDRWLHLEGNLVLLGDSAHPMLPYVAQGASSAAEDAAALAECLTFIDEDRSLRDVLDVYQKIRIPRALSMRNAARKNREYFHMPDAQFQDKSAGFMLTLDQDRLRRLEMLPLRKTQRQTSRSLFLAIQKPPVKCMATISLKKSGRSSLQRTASCNCLQSEQFVYL